MDSSYIQLDNLASTIMTNEQALHRYLKISENQYDAVWHFCAAFSFKLQAIGPENNLGIHLIFLHPSTDVYSYKITGRSACRDFLDNPLAYLLQAIEFYGINIGRVTVSQGGAKKIIDLSVNDTFTVF